MVYAERERESERDVCVCVCVRAHTHTHTDQTVCMCICVYIKIRRSWERWCAPTAPNPIVLDTYTCTDALSACYRHIHMHKRALYTT